MMQSPDMLKYFSAQHHPHHPQPAHLGDGHPRLLGEVADVSERRPSARVRSEAGREPPLHRHRRLRS